MLSIKIPTPIIIWFDFHFVILFAPNPQSDHSLFKRQQNSIGFLVERLNQTNLELPLTLYQASGQNIDEPG